MKNEAQAKVTQFPKTGNNLQGLKQRIPSEQIKQRIGWRDKEGKTHYLDYVEWHTVADILDRETPDWAHSVKDIRQIGDILTITVAITIDGITREGVGTGTAESEMGIKKAEHDALKRAAVKFGVGRELYKKETELIERTGSANSFGFDADAPPANPLATGIMNLVSPKQLGLIRFLSRSLSIDAEEECHNIWQDTKCDQLSKRAASWFIGHLQELQTGRCGGVLELSPKPEGFKTQNVTNFPANFTPTEQKQIAEWRNRMQSELESVGMKSENWLAVFDSRCPTFAAKKAANEKTLRAVADKKLEQVKVGLAESGWEINEIEGFMSKFGIEEGLEAAGGEQIKKIWADMKRDRMI